MSPGRPAADGTRRRASETVPDAASSAARPRHNISYRAKAAGAHRPAHRRGAAQAGPDALPPPPVRSSLASGNQADNIILDGTMFLLKQVTLICLLQFCLAVEDLTSFCLLPFVRREVCALIVPPRRAMRALQHSSKFLQ